MKDVIVYDEELDLTFYYPWDDKTGYNCRLPPNLPREDMRRYLKNSKKHWPEVPEYLKEEIDKYNKEILEACKAIDCWSEE